MLWLTDHSNIKNSYLKSAVLYDCWVEYDKRILAAASTNSTRAFIVDLESEEACVLVLSGVVLFKVSEILPQTGSCLGFDYSYQIKLVDHDKFKEWWG